MTENKGTLAIVTTGVNYFLFKSINNFISEIAYNTDLLDKIESDIVETSLFESELDKLLLHTFPFLRIRE